MFFWGNLASLTNVPPFTGDVSANSNQLLNKLTAGLAVDTEKKKHH